jgi:hypothetical protein
MAPRLVDHVLPAVPVRQRVLTIPSPLLAKLLGAAAYAATDTRFGPCPAVLSEADARIRATSTAREILGS